MFLIIFPLLEAREALWGCGGGKAFPGTRKALEDLSGAPGSPAGLQQIINHKSFGWSGFLNNVFNNAPLPNHDSLAAREASWACGGGKGFPGTRKALEDLSGAPGKPSGPSTNQKSRPKLGHGTGPVPWLA